MSNFELGGLDIGSLHASNLGLLGKWWWRFHNESDSFWVKIMKSIHGSDGGLKVSSSSSQGCGGTWGEILRVGKVLKKKKA